MLHLLTLTSKSANCHATLCNAQYVHVHMRTLYTEIERDAHSNTHLGRDFSNSIISAQAHKSAHNFTTTHASSFKFAGRSV